MFDISFGQLFLVLIVGLVVLGPKKLPVAIKTVAGWIKTLRSISATVQLELSRELKLQELQDSLKKAEESGLKSITPEIQASIDDLKRVTDSMKKAYQDDIQAPLMKVKDDISDAVTEKPEEPQEK
ncbi:Sec-independent protein translocase subunit TatB [Zophobihabitans entericus]|uniref:Sec-independent protein translocase protein TatB n=1 Tax=Zophobihabitans entericus TaxID=1635327 RepID=A0A6G9IDC2_9GAMM|nr:Sec-independent protein translocase protein TatB [Zophobihabitans entericus]QIQ22223.1 Sec-independent protein translocase subunit TatB [Zophobihabitans entericus]